MSAILINQLKLIPSELRVYRGKEIVSLQPKCTELLIYLAERPGQVISKQTLLNAIWKGSVVGEDVLTSCIRKLRKQLNDDAKSPQLIETINKKGYRLIAKVRAPRLKWWWLKLSSKIFAGLFSVAIISFVSTHSHVSVYSFSSSESVHDRNQKLKKMAGIIEQDPNGTHSISYSFND